MNTMKGPGKAYRKGISLVDAMKRFGDDAEAERWFVARRWPEGVRCAYCASDRITSRKPNRKTPTYHCQACLKDFTVKTGGVMHDSKLPLGKWAVAFYLFSTNLKGVSSMKLHRDLGITQKSAWHMAHRIRETWDNGTRQFVGPVEVDETYIGGLEKNKHGSKKQRLGRGPVGKTAVVGIRDRDTNRVNATVVEAVDARTLHGFVHRNTQPYTTVYTDDASAYVGMDRPHEAVHHGVREYVRGQASTNGIESHWAMLKRGYQGVYHQMSAKHLGRYVMEFSGRHNDRPSDTIDQMSRMADRMIGKRLRYDDLTG